MYISVRLEKKDHFIFGKCTLNVHSLFIIHLCQQ